jgi:hypothetical protein
MLLSSLAAVAACSFGVAHAGDLAPPGAPGPTMKTLDQVEARIPVGPLTTPGDAGAVYVISQSGSYYLTENLLGVAGKSGILITATKVTLDLNGFSLDGQFIGLDGVRMATWRDNVVVRNGTIANWTGDGLDFRSDNGRLEDLSVTACGAWGIYLHDSFSVRVRNCGVYSCGDEIGVTGGGIYGSSDVSIDDCTVRSVDGMGIYALSSVVRNCLVFGVTGDAAVNQPGDGIRAMQVESCQVRYATGVGVTGQMLVRSCVSMDNSGANYSGPNIVDSY